MIVTGGGEGRGEGGGEGRGEGGEIPTVNFTAIEHYKKNKSFFHVYLISSLLPSLPSSLTCFFSPHLLSLMLSLTCSLTKVIFLLLEEILRVKQRLGKTNKELCPEEGRGEWRSGAEGREEEQRGRRRLQMRHTCVGGGVDGGGR